MLILAEIQKITCKYASAWLYVVQSKNTDCSTLIK